VVALTAPTWDMDLPDTWAEQVAAYPPCDQDVVLAEDELDDLLAEDADRRNDDLFLGAWS
jgi:hypothetical protein